MHSPWNRWRSHKNNLWWCKFDMDAPLNLEAMTHRVHPDQSLPVLGVADVNQSVQFTWPDAVGNKLNICQSIDDTPFLCTQDHSTEVSVDNVWTKTFELRYQLQITKEQQQFYTWDLLRNGTSNSSSSCCNNSLRSIITSASVHKIVTSCYNNSSVRQHHCHHKDWSTEFARWHQ